MLIRVRCRPPAILLCLSLHDALPISERTIVLAGWDGEEYGLLGSTEWAEEKRDPLMKHAVAYLNLDGVGGKYFRSEEHTAELQARFELVCRLLLEKKKCKEQRRCGCS